MKHLIFISAAFHFATLFANDVLIERCEQSLLNQGSGVEDSAPENSCRNTLVESIAESNHHRVGLQDKMVVSLGVGLSFSQSVEGSTQHYFLSGDQTHISQSQAIRPKGENFTELLVVNALEGQPSILHFDASFPGNIAPKAIYQGEIFQDTLDIDIDLKAKQLYVLHGDTRSLRVYHSEYHLRQADKSKRQAKLLATYQLTRPAPLSFAIIDSQMLAILYSGGELALVDRVTLEEIQIISLEKDSTEGLSLQWDETRERLLVLEQFTILEEYQL